MSLLRLFKRPKFPLDHRPAMQVPKGGSSCANCRFYTAAGGLHGSCVEPNFIQFYKTAQIPCPPDQFCSDWYEPTTLVRIC